MSFIQCGPLPSCRKEPSSPLQPPPQPWSREGARRGAKQEYRQRKISNKMAGLAQRVMAYAKQRRPHAKKMESRIKKSAVSSDEPRLLDSIAITIYQMTAGNHAFKIRSFDKINFSSPWAISPFMVNRPAHLQGGSAHCGLDRY